MSKKLFDIKQRAKVVGVVVEYNPFHNGHLYHLERAKEITGAEVVVAVMSGDFVQRGEPAAFDRFTRSKMALKGGVDLLVELPIIYSTQNAEIFALGAVNILLNLEVDYIVFGSESGEIDTLEKIAKLEESSEFKEAITFELKKGLSYPAAFSLALKSLGVDYEINSNDILGIEYIRAKNRLVEMYPYLDRSCKMKVIKRIGTGYHDLDIAGNIASATGIRAKIIESQEIKTLIPSTTKDVISTKNQDKIVTLGDYYPLIRYSIINNYRRLLEIQDMEPGLENRLYTCAREFGNFQEFMEGVTTKRYTKGRLQRVLIHTLLNITKERTIAEKYRLSYIKVLGFRDKGQSYLKSIKESGKSKEEKFGITLPKIIMGMRNIRKELKESERESLEFNEEGSAIYKMVNSYQDEGVIIIR